MKDLKEGVSDLLDELKKSYPPESHGIRRLLPQNWVVEPQVPEECREAYERVAALRGRWLDPQGLPKEEDFVALSELNVPQVFVERVRSSLQDVSKMYKLGKQEIRLMAPDPDVGVAHFFVLFAIINGLLWGTFAKRSWEDTGRLIDRVMGNYQMRSRIFAYILLPALIPSMMRADPVLTGGALFIAGGFVVLGVMTFSSEWPRNPFMDVVADLGMGDTVRLTRGDERPEKEVKALLSAVQEK